MTNKQELKPGKYAVLFRNNWDGEGDTYETLAILDEVLVWRDENGDELFEFQGDAVLKAWPLNDGSNVLALLDELEDYKAAYEEYARDKEVQRSVIDHALCKLLPGCQYMDQPDGGSVTPLEQVRRMVDDYRERIAELEASHSKLRESMAAIHNTIRRDGAHTSLAVILNAAKRAHDESAAATGIRINGEG